MFKNLNRDDCKAQFFKFLGPIYKKFTSKVQAEEFIKQNSSVSSNYSKYATGGRKSENCNPAKNINSVP